MLRKQVLIRLYVEKFRSASDDVIGVTTNNICILSTSLNKLFMFFDVM